MNQQDTTDNTPAPNKHKQIFRNQSAFGGVSYRVTSDGTTAHIQSSNQGTSWKTEKKMPHAEFEKWADDVGLHDPYDQNPAKLSKLAHS
jgi:hypothetical protein